jgi:hypothetical protein
MMVAAILRLMPKSKTRGATGPLSLLVTSSWRRAQLTTWHFFLNLYTQTGKATVVYILKIMMK